MIKLAKHQIIIIHEELIRESGGCTGVRDDALLESALAAPFQEYAGVELFPSIQAKAARLCYGLVKNHPMIDGNKRIGAHVMLIFLALNGYELRYTQQELIDMILEIASGNKDNEELSQWILAHQV